MQKKLLWSTPVYEFDLNMSESDNTYLFDLLSDSKYNVHNINSGQSTFPHRVDDIVVKKLYTQIHECLDKCVYEYYPKSYSNFITMSWVYTQKPGHYMNLHSHNKSSFVASYYVRVPKNSGNLVLVDPRGGVEWFNENGNVDYTTVFHEIEPNEGTLVVFPGYVLHEVQRNQSPLTRMCIANNITCDLPNKQIL